MQRLLFILYVVASAFQHPASALEITYSNVNPFSGDLAKAETLVLRGEIVPGDYEYLLEIVHRDQDRFARSLGFVLASQGGDIEEALKIARFVKGTYSAVVVAKHTGPCVSACFFIYVSATSRLASPGTLGIHRPYIHPRRLASATARNAEKLQRASLQQARSYLEGQDVPTNLIDKMFQRASTEVYWLSQDEIEEQIGRRPPWYEQFLIARCGFDKSLERKYFLTNDSTILDYLWGIDDCGTRLSLPEASAYLRSELQKLKAR